MSPIFHFSLSVSDLARTREFYESTLQGDVGRTTENWFDIWLFGSQVTIYHRPAGIVPLPYRRGLHFGATLEWGEWMVFRNHLDGLNLNYELEPIIDAERGTAKLMISDPDGYLIELKSYKDVHAQLKPPVVIRS